MSVGVSSELEALPSADSRALFLLPTYYRLRGARTCDALQFRAVHFDGNRDYQAPRGSLGPMARAIGKYPVSAQGRCANWNAEVRSRPRVSLDCLTFWHYCPDRYDELVSLKNVLPPNEGQLWQSWLPSADSIVVNESNDGQLKLMDLDGPLTADAGVAHKATEDRAPEDLQKLWLDAVGNLLEAIKSRDVAGSRHLVQTLGSNELLVRCGGE